MTYEYKKSRSGVAVFSSSKPIANFTLQGFSGTLTFNKKEVDEIPLENLLEIAKGVVSVYDFSRDFYAYLAERMNAPNSTVQFKGHWASDMHAHEYIRHGKGKLLINSRAEKPKEEEELPWTLSKTGSELRLFNKKNDRYIVVETVEQEEGTAVFFSLAVANSIPLDALQAILVLFAREKLLVEKSFFEHVQSRLATRLSLKNTPANPTEEQMQNPSETPQPVTKYQFASNQTNVSVIKNRVVVANFYKTESPCVVFIGDRVFDFLEPSEMRTIAKQLLDYGSGLTLNPSSQKLALNAMYGEEPTKALSVKELQNFFYGTDADHEAIHAKLTATKAEAAQEKPLLQEGVIDPAFLAQVWPDQIGSSSIGEWGLKLHIHSGHAVLKNEKLKFLVEFAILPTNVSRNDLGYFYVVEKPSELFGQLPPQALPHIVTLCVGSGLLLDHAFFSCWSNFLNSKAGQAMQMRESLVSRKDDVDKELSEADLQGVKRADAEVFRLRSTLAKDWHEQRAKDKAAAEEKPKTVFFSDSDLPHLTDDEFLAIGDKLRASGTQPTAAYLSETVRRLYGPQTVEARKAFTKKLTEHVAGDKKMISFSVPDRVLKNSPNSQLQGILNELSNPFTRSNILSQKLLFEIRDGVAFVYSASSVVVETAFLVEAQKSLVALGLKVHSTFDISLARSLGDISNMDMVQIGRKASDISARFDDRYPQFLHSDWLKQQIFKKMNGLI